ncbi:MAG: hypothetical protein OXG85_03510 [Chloroflexi bacterium]|nr:hypothetical protein [Chloroflexota bacterium]
MDEPLSLTLLYTANIAGDLALLPRLFTFLGRLKSEAGPLVLLLDLGRSCADEVWHCRETGGRSALIALDGMGYHAANVAGALDPETRDQLAEQVTMALVDERRDWLYDSPLTECGIRSTLRPRDFERRLQIVLSPADSMRIEGNALYLGAVGAGQVGAAVVDLRGAPALISASARMLPPDTPPNPSIAGMVEFVEAEARYFARQAR